jgi:plastocyanin
MIARFIFLVSVLFFSGSALAGTITGTVRAKGAERPASSNSDDGYGSRRYKFVEKVDYEHLQDFVVSIDQVIAATGKPDGVGQPTIVQRDASFEPHVLPIAVGTGVRWPNEDDIYHNVFSMSDTKDFNLGLYGKEKTPVIIFDKVGRVDVFCGIHTKMHCIVLVLPNEYFAMADSRGRYAIKGVPPGTYRLKAWQERMPAQVKEVVVPADGETKMDFVLGLSDLPKS